MSDSFAEWEAEEAAMRAAAYDRDQPAILAKMANETAKVAAGVGVETDAEREMAEAADGEEDGESE